MSFVNGLFSHPWVCHLQLISKCNLVPKWVMPGSLACSETAEVWVWGTFLNSSLHQGRWSCHLNQPWWLSMTGQLLRESRWKQHQHGTCTCWPTVAMWSCYNSLFLKLFHIHLKRFAISMLGCYVHHCCFISLWKHNLSHLQ